MILNVYGEPAPQGSKRHIGGGRMIESSKKVKPWRETVKWEWLNRYSTYPPIDTPVQIHLHFTLPKPKNAPKTKTTYPMRKPDIDKLIRSTLDALTDAGALTDDARVITITATKNYPNETNEALDRPGVRIIINNHGETQ